jgi:DNA-directed RNA polymerase alpha subunit
MIIEDNKELLLVFQTESIPYQILNGLRRIMYSEVPTYTIDFIRLFKNNTYYNDEFLAHRLGLVPFVVNYKTMENESEIDFMNVTCEDDSCYQVKLCVDNDTDFHKKVYSKHFEIIPNENAIFYPVAFEGYPDGIHLLTLAPGQSIDFICNLKKGNGKLHSKWSPVTGVFYKRIDNDTFQMSIESIGSQPAVDIFRKSISIWKSKIESITSLQILS